MLGYRQKRPDTNPMPTPAQLASIFADAINSGDEPLLRSICASTYQGYDTSRKAAQHGRLGLLEDLKRLSASFPDGRITLIHQISNGSTTGVFWVLNGTHQGSFLGIPATSRRVSICGYSHLDFEGGLLQRATHIWDMAALLRSLRLLPDLPDRDTGEDLILGMRRTLLKPSTAAYPRPTQ